MDGQKRTEDFRGEQFILSYEAPCIEAVLTPEELEREVLYAGTISQPG